MNYRIYFYVPWKEAEKEAPKEFLAKQEKNKAIKEFADIYPKSLALVLKNDIATETFLEKV